MADVMWKVGDTIRCKGALSIFNDHCTKGKTYEILHIDESHTTTRQTLGILCDNGEFWWVNPVSFELVSTSEPTGWEMP
jgi:hypothetical protein